MRLATLPDGTRDGRLVVVSADDRKALDAGTVASTLQAALDRWDEIAPRLSALDGPGEPFDPAAALAPLPRAWQWLDASAFPSHAALMDTVFGMAPSESARPLMYQGLSHRFYAAEEDVPFSSAEDWIDFEGEFGVIVDETPLGVSPVQAMAHIKLIVVINDWSLRRLAPIEMKTGFGWIQAKPPCSMSPVALTPDELGAAWRDGRVHLPLLIDWNGSRFGAAHGGAMAYGFHELVAHAAATRNLCAGSIIGSGTVSNENFREVGSSCIAERRGIEIVDHGSASTPYMAFGDRVRLEAVTAQGRPLFGAIDQQVVKTGATHV